MARPKQTPKATASEPTGASSRPLSPRRAAFVREFIAAGCTNAKQAAIRAGYAGGASAEVTASRLLRDPKVDAEIKQAQAGLLRRCEISRERIISELAAIAFFDPQELFDDDNQLLPWDRIPERALRALEVEFRDGKLHKVRNRDRQAALSMLLDLLGPPELPRDAEMRIPLEVARLILGQGRGQRAPEDRAPPETK